MQHNNKINKVLKNWIIPVFIALFLALIFQVFFIKLVRYSGDSMESTLYKGDYIFIGIYNSFKVDDIVLVESPLDENSDDLFFKRCVAVSGDTLEIKNAVLFVNNKEFSSKGNIINSYRILAYDSVSEFVITNGYYAKKEQSVTGMYNVNFDNNQISEITNDSLISNIQKSYIPKGYNNSLTFPYSYQYRWNKDNFGPIIIPEKGQTIFLNTKSIPLYKQIIMNYEENDFEEKNDKYFIDGKETQYYTFQKNYVFVLNDNRLDQNDSRSWGLIPEDKINGKALFIFYANQKSKRIFERL